jgi:penicillin amidase
MNPIPLKHSRRRIEIARDDAGVPHVQAGSWREALYALGYLHALDRPTQVLFGRVMASGQAAEQIANKPELVETDRFFRRAGLYQHLDREVGRLDDRTFADLTAYCEGVNDGLKQSGRSLPMWATRFRPQPWDQKAVLLLGNMLSFAGLAVGQQQSERLLLELIQVGIDDAKLRELFAPRLDGVDFELLRKIKLAHQLSDEALELIADLPRLIGSNAWAVAPSRSATGGALLASDPHLEVNRLPAIWYEAVLRFGDRFVMGATLPGCPLFAVGRTERLSWGVTYMKGDATDYFIEDCRPGGATGWQYRRGDAWHDFALRQEIIARKKAAPDSLRIYHNEVGTLEVDPEATGPGYYLSSAWVGHGEGAGRAIGVWLDVIDAPSAPAAMDIVRELSAPTLCWIFADAAGNIGLQGSGWVPKRRAGNTGLTPVAAWDEKNHWRGWLESHHLPRELNPARGFVAAANEDINQPGGPLITTMPLPDYRKRRISERLAEMPAATVADMQTLQYDVTSVQARELLQIFLPHLPEGPLKSRLAAWDLRYAPESIEPTLFAGLYRNVLLEIFGFEHGIGWRRMLYLCTRFGFSIMVLTAIDRLLVKEHSAWWTDRNKGDLIRRAAERTAREKQQPWSKTNAFRFTNRFFPNRVGRVLGFNTGELPMPGCHATPFQGHLLRTASRESTFAPSYHFVTDMSTAEAWTNLPGGPTESRFSQWYKSDIPLWRSARYKRLTSEMQNEK